MSEKLEKEYIEDLDHYDEGIGIHSTSYQKCKERLIRLAKIESAEPSEAIKCLHTIAFNTQLCGINFGNELRTIEQALLKIQENARSEKILAVIKKTPCNSGLCINYLKANRHYPNMQDYEHYCMTIREFDRVSEDEFNVLKEWILE